MPFQFSDSFAGADEYFARQRERPFREQQLEAGRLSNRERLLKLTEDQRQLEEAQRLRSAIKDAMGQNDQVMTAQPVVATPGEVQMGSVNPAGINGGPDRKLPERIMLEMAQKAGNLAEMTKASTFIESRGKSMAALGDHQGAANYITQATGFPHRYDPSKGDFILVPKDTVAHNVTTGQQIQGRQSTEFAPANSTAVRDGVAIGPQFPGRTDTNLSEPELFKQDPAAFQRYMGMKALSRPATADRSDERSTRLRFNQEQQLARQFNNLPEVKEHAAVAKNVSRAREAMNEAKIPGKSLIAVDQVLINSLNKMIDENSVVRESEYARTAVDQSLLNRIRGKVEQWSRGGAGLEQTERQTVFDMIERFHKASKARYERQASFAKETATGYELDPERVVRPVGLPDEGPAQGGPLKVLRIERVQ